MPDVYVSTMGLMVNITRKDLKGVFRKYGRVGRIKTYEGRSYGFVEMYTEEGAQNAISGVNGTTLRDWHLHVRYGHSNNNAVNKSDGDCRIRPESSKNSQPCKRPSGDQRGLSYDSRVIVSRTRGNDGQASVINQTEIGDHSDDEGQPYSVKRARRDVSNGIAPDLVLPDGNVITSFSRSSALNETNNSVNETSQSTSSESTKSKKKTLGAETFEAVRDSKFFIDKTRLIKEIIHEDAKTLHITAPARFGKSVNLAMLKSFLSARITKDGRILSPQLIEESAFRETEIAKDTEFISRHFQRYIVLFVDFSKSAEDSEEAIQAMRSSVISVYKKHSYLKNHLHEHNLRYFEYFINHFYEMNAVLLRNCLLNLVKMLHSYHNGVTSDEKSAQFKFVLLVDEFDAPVINTMFSVDAETLTSIANHRDAILGQVTKSVQGDRLLFMSVFTGIADIYCSATSLLRNLKRYPFLSSKNVFAPYYGVSIKELKQVLKKNPQLKVTFKELCYMYNGYKWDSVKSDKTVQLLNMWSIMNALNVNDCDVYFAAVSRLIMVFKPYLRCEEFKTLITELTKGQDYYCPNVNFNKPISVEELSELVLNCKDKKKNLNDLQIICALLFQIGWITLGSPNHIRVPNEEIRSELHRDFYYDYFIDKYELDFDKREQCGIDFRKFFKGDFKVENFCKSFHSFCYYPSRTTKFKLNHDLMISFLLIICCETGLKLKAVGVEFPIKESGVSTRCDNVFYLEPYIMIVVLKCNETAEKAMDQIWNSKYMDVNKNPFILDKNERVEKFVLLGINVNTEGRKKTEIIAQVMESDKTTQIAEDTFTHYET